MREYSEEEKDRRKKLLDLRKAGVNPYSNGLTPSHAIKDVVGRWGLSSGDELGEDRVSIAGRIMAFRYFGKASFIEVKDGSGSLQAYVTGDNIPKESFEHFKTFDVGDFVFLEGELFRTKKNVLSVRARELTLLTKSLRPLPEKFHGLVNMDQKYRMRYVDLLVNKGVREVFEKRSKILHYLRTFFQERDFLEVETPMMHPIAGGAAARPFQTHHNTLGMDLFLRIAPELYLKRLVVGGIERVFEINRNFRNEGMSIQHNPEFTMLEFYQAYATYEDLMVITEKLFIELAFAVRGSLKFMYQDTELDFSTPWQKFSMLESVQKFSGLPKELVTKKALSTVGGLCKALEHAGVKGVDRNKKAGVLLELLFGECVEGKLIQPTFITEYPKEISFLSRSNEKNPDIVDRFELFIYGREIANGFSELNDPIDQRERLEAQAKEKAQGNKEACDLDEDFLRALEYGMPPTAGEGIGIDRLTMLLTDQSSIRDVILFPQMRPES